MLLLLNPCTILVVLSELPDYLFPPSVCFPPGLVKLLLDVICGVLEGLHALIQPVLQALQSLLHLLFCWLVNGLHARQQREKDGLDPGPAKDEVFHHSSLVPCKSTAPRRREELHC